MFQPWLFLISRIYGTTFLRMFSYYKLVQIKCSVHCLADCPFNQALTKLKQAKHGCVYIPAVFDWAIKKNKKVDVFMNFLCYNHSLDLIPKEQRDKEKPVGALNRYRKKLNVPQAK